MQTHFSGHPHISRIFATVLQQLNQPLDTYVANIRLGLVSRSLDYKDNTVS